VNIGGGPGTKASTSTPQTVQVLSNDELKNIASTIPTINIG
jgi:hypothetical protein